jgi:hypothetical protein
MNTQTTHTSEGTASARRLLDNTSRAQMPSPYLLDTRPPAPRKTPPRLRMIKTEHHESAVCGFGVCNLTPECTSRCRYREAAQALQGQASERHTQRAEMPPIKPRRTEAERREAVRLRRLVFGCLAASWIVMGLYIFF